MKGMMTIPHLSLYLLPTSTLSFDNPLYGTTPGKPFSFPLKFPFLPKYIDSDYPSSNFFVWNFSIWKRTHTLFCSSNDAFEEFPGNHLIGKSQDEPVAGMKKFKLLNKPFPAPIVDQSGTELVSEPKKPPKDEALAPFLKFFESKDSVNKITEEDGERDSDISVCAEECYEPKAGDFVVGVVVSGNENKLDVNIGADLVGTMLTKEILPLYDKEMEHLLCKIDNDAKSFMVSGKIGIIKNIPAVNGDDEPVLPSPGRPVVEIGTVVFAEVLGRTLSGRPLLSSRKLFRKVAWHRARQIEQLNEPIEVMITEWNTAGLLTRIEGLRGFLPKSDLFARVNNFNELKENVGRRMYVKIIKINEANNELILSEKDAWESLHLEEGTVLEGIVKKIYPYGAQIRIGETNRSGLLHISNISKNRVPCVEDVLEVDEKVKAMVVKSMTPEKIFLSTAELESVPGMFLSNKERVYSEAEEMAKKYRRRMPARNIPPLSSFHSLPFLEENTAFSNWRCFQFQST